MKPVLSIIVPVYNVEEYVGRCIDSILHQTFSDFELILIDDGSLDNGGSICDQYAKQDARISVIHQPNRGLSAARNAGLDRAAGEYIGFVDSDDWIQPDMYETMLAIAGKYQADLVECGYFIVDGGDSTVVGGGQFEVCDNIAALHRLLTHCSYDMAWNKLYHRHLFEKLRFPVGKIYEDSFIMYKMFFQAKKYVFSGSSKYNYFLREQSIMQQQRARYSSRNLQRLECYQERYYYLQDKNIPDAFIMNQAEYEYLAELLFHYGMNLKTADTAYRKKLRLTIAANYNNFMKNPLVTKCNKFWLVLAKCNEKLFAVIYRFRLSMGRRLQLYE